MAHPQKVAPGIFLIDAQLYGMPQFLAVYLVVGERLTLIDTGPTSSSPFVLEGIQGLGFRPEDISLIVLTHIHSDHAGGVGTLLREMPQAEVIIQERGARHLVDPTRWIKSLLEGPGEYWMRRDGPILPVPQERVRGVKGGEVVELGKGYCLEVVATPGHHPTSISLYEQKTCSLFTGDTLGVALPDGARMPLCPPPNFDLDQALASLDRLQALSLGQLLFAHFGPSSDVQGCLNRARDNLQLFGRIARDQGLEGLRAWGERELASLKGKGLVWHFLMEEMLPMAAQGLRGFFQRQGGG